MTENDLDLDKGWNTPATGLPADQAKKPPAEHVSGVREAVQDELLNAAATDETTAAADTPEADRINSDSPLPEKISTPAPASELAPEPTPAPESIPEPAPEPVSEPASEPAPAATSEPEPTPAPAPEPEPAPEPAPLPAAESIPALVSDEEIGLSIPPPPAGPVLSLRPPEHIDAETSQAILTELLAQRETDEILKMRQDPENIDQKNFYLLSTEAQAQVAITVVIAKGMDYLISSFPAYIPGVIFATNLFEAGLGEQVAFHLGIFKNLEHAGIAEALIAQGKGWAVASNISNFKDIDYKKILLKLLKAGQKKAVTQNIAAFSKHIDQEGIFELINAGCPEAAASVLPSLRNLGVEIALDLTKNGCGPAVAKNIKSFSPETHNEIAMRLIEGKMAKDLSVHIRKFAGLDKSIALALIDSGDTLTAASEIALFPATDHNEIACELLAADRASLLDVCFRNFRQLEKDTVKRLIKAGYITGICENAGSIKNIDEELVQEIIYAAKKIGVNPPMRELVLRLIELGKGTLVLSLFTDTKLFDEEIYRKLIAAGHFEELSKKVGAQLLEHKFFRPR